MGGSAVKNKTKPNKWQFGSGGDTHLINNVDCSINQYPPCSNQNNPSETPSVEAQTIKKTCQMDSKYRCLGYHHTRSIYSETIDTGSTTHSYTKESNCIYTVMVHVIFPFRDVTDTPNGIIVKYSDGSIAQATHYALLKIPLLTFKAHRVHQFDTLA